MDTKSPQPKGSADLRGIPVWPEFAQWRSALRERFASASSLSWSMWAWATMTSMVENIADSSWDRVFVCSCLARPGIARRVSREERANAGGVGATLRVKQEKRRTSLAAVSGA